MSDCDCDEDQACEHCQAGYSPFAQKLLDRWYGHDLPRTGYGYWNASWANNLEQQDVDVLWEENELQPFFSEKPTEQAVNQLSRSDSLFRIQSIGWMYQCVTARCKVANEPVRCGYCNGTGLEKEV